MPTSVHVRIRRLPAPQPTARCCLIAQIPACYGLQPATSAGLTGTGAWGTGSAVARMARATAQPSHELGAETWRYTGKGRRGIIPRGPGADVAQEARLLVLSVPQGSTPGGG